MHRRYQMGYSVVTDTAAKVLGVWERNGGAAFVRKALGEGTFVFVARDGGLSPSLLNALARQAGVTPYAEPGNATYVGNGVACVHRLNGPARVDFGCLVTPVDPVTGKKGTPLRIWEPALDVGSSAAIGYLLSTAADAR